MIWRFTGSLQELYRPNHGIYCDDTEWESEETDVSYQLIGPLKLIDEDSLKGVERGSFSFLRMPLIIVAFASIDYTYNQNKSIKIQSIQKKYLIERVLIIELWYT